jgi:hypothetical protein
LPAFGCPSVDLGEKPKKEQLQEKKENSDSTPDTSEVSSNSSLPDDFGCWNP